MRSSGLSKTRIFPTKSRRYIALIQKKEPP